MKKKKEKEKEEDNEKEVIVREVRRSWVPMLEK